MTTDEQRFALFCFLFSLIVEQQRRIHALEHQCKVLSEAIDSEREAVKVLPFRLIGKSTMKVEFGD